ncbi:hypothetical protein BGX38DRAFT_552207 [Terfezia claveryi]|nr:hypothetical protein BGX38DRAFT_552207 [Terfezia claveryi]
MVPFPHSKRLGTPTEQRNSHRTVEDPVAEVAQVIVEIAVVGERAGRGGGDSGGRGHRGDRHSGGGGRRDSGRGSGGKSGNRGDGDSGRGDGDSRHGDSSGTGESGGDSGAGDSGGAELAILGSGDRRWAEEIAAIAIAEAQIGELVAGD